MFQTSGNRSSSLGAGGGEEEVVGRKGKGVAYREYQDLGETIYILCMCGSGKISQALIHCYGNFINDSIISGRPWLT